MKINIQTKHIRIGQQFEERVNVKLGKYDRYFGEGAEAWVKVRHEGNDFCVELTMKVKKHYYRAEQLDNDLIAAFDKTFENLDRQIRKQKTKLEKRHKDFSYLKSYLDNSEPEAAQEAKLVKTKKYRIDKMSAEDAALQMELLNHSFLLFLDEQNGKVNLIYKRKDGNYGIIEPEYDK